MGEPIQREPLRIRITLDDGIASYLRALVKCPFGIFGDERETIVYLTRSGLIKLWESPSYREAMLPYLPQDIQDAWRQPLIHPSPKGEA